MACGEGALGRRVCIGSGLLEWRLVGGMGMKRHRFCDRISFVSLWGSPLWFHFSLSVVEAFRFKAFVLRRHWDLGTCRAAGSRVWIFLY